MRVRGVGFRAYALRLRVEGLSLVVFFCLAQSLGASIMGCLGSCLGSWYSRCSQKRFWDQDLGRRHGLVKVQGLRFRIQVLGFMVESFVWVQSLGFGVLG